MKTQQIQRGSMHHCSTNGTFKFDVYTGRNSFVKGYDQIANTGGLSQVDASILSSKEWILEQSFVWNNIPTLISIKKAENLIAVIFLYGGTYLGLPTGVFRSPYSCGRGGIVILGDDIRDIVNSLKVVFERTRHLREIQLRIPLLGHSTIPTESSEIVSDGVKHVIPAPSVFSLDGGVDGVLSRFGPKMRKNFRYQRKRARDILGVNFVSDMNDTQSDAAVSQLYAYSTRKLSLKNAISTHKLVCSSRSIFRMGLSDQSGQWISFVAGWRENESTFVYWQLNCKESNNISLSMAMRSYLIEHEANRGGRQIVFVGGTTEIWGRYCETANALDINLRKFSIINGLRSIRRSTVKPR